MSCNVGFLPKSLIFCLLCMLAIYPLFGQKSLEKDSSFVKKDLDTLSVGESKSGYDDIVVTGGSNSVGSDLKRDDTKKETWLKLDYAKKVFNEYYDFKRYLKRKMTAFPPLL